MIFKNPYLAGYICPGSIDTLGYTIFYLKKTRDEKQNHGNDIEK